MKARTPFTAVSLLVMFLILQSCGQAAEKSAEPVNIIFLLTDDQRVGVLGFEGNPIIQTPNIDRLAAEGTYFENSFVTTPICCTSRASTLTGQYARRHGINDFATHLSPEALAATYPSLLREAGYYTGFVGKYGVGNREEEAPRDYFDFWRGLHFKEYWGQGHYWQDSVHLTRLMAEQSLEFLEQVPKDVPFCLSVSFKAPHCQDSHPDQFLYDTTRYSELYKDAYIPVPELNDERYWELFPDFFRSDDNEARIRWRRRFGTPELYQEMVKSYYRLVTGVDDALGLILEDLRKRGLDKNTIIVYTGDNGFYLGERGLAGKWYSHEESLRVPLIIYDPRVDEVERSRVSQIALNIDIAPTLLGFAGVPVPEDIQGKDLRQLMMEGDRRDMPGKSASSWRQDFFFEHRFIRHNIPESEGVISLDKKYVRYVEEEPVHEWLYDLELDPREIHNYRDSASHREELERLRARYREYLQNLE